MNRRQDRHRGDFGADAMLDGLPGELRAIRWYQDAAL